MLRLTAARDLHASQVDCEICELKWVHAKPAFLQLCAECGDLMAQVEFEESKGEIPVEFLHVEYKLFREDLSALMGKPPTELPGKGADDER